MKSLMILRHAEAAAAGNGPDIERSLTGAGRAQAHALGRLLREWEMPLGRIVCSSAKRTRETAEFLVAGREAEVPLIVAEELYNASGEGLLKYLQNLPDDGDRILVVAHVPGVAELASMLVTEHVDLALIYKAATLVEIAMEEDRWSELDYGVGILRLVLPPVSAGG